MQKALLLSLVLVLGCDKIKAVAGGGGEGGAPPSILGDTFATDFEGEITAKLTSSATPAKPQLVTFGIKRPKYRMDLTDGAAAPGTPALGSVIMDAPTKRGWMLVHPQKVAMVLDLTKPRPQLPNLPGVKQAPPAPTTPPKIEKTGKKDSVAGYGCEIWNVVSEGRTSEVCMAENLTWIDMGDMGFQSPEVTLAAVATGGNHFPLRVITHDMSGKEEMRMEAQKVEKKPLDDGRFAPPADYRQFDPSSLPQLPQLPQIPTAKR